MKSRLGISLLLLAVSTLLFTARTASEAQSIVFPRTNLSGGVTSVNASDAQPDASTPAARVTDARRFLLDAAEIIED